jgi:Zn-dependent protease
MTPDRLRIVLLTVVTLVLSVAVHEFFHAFAAHKLGDDYPERNGRLTLNPLAHIDPIGTLLVPALFAFLGAGGFGWGRPVEIIPTNINRKYSMRAGEALIAFAGPASNLVLAILSALLWAMLRRFALIETGSPFNSLLAAMIELNVVLFFFNLLPVPPLDGSKIIAWLFGQKADRFLDAIAQVGPVALMLVVAVGGYVINPFVRVVVDIIYRVI